MRGYWNRPEETARMTFPGRWLRTDDVGAHRREGLCFRDRKKDMIVCPASTCTRTKSSAGVMHPGVLEVLAVASADKRSEQIVVLFCLSGRKIRGLPEPVTVPQVAHGSQSTHKVYLKNELPKTHVAKILRRALRDELGK
jgi:long-chain acyl-CoA synthetase